MTNKLALLKQLRELQTKTNEYVDSLSNDIGTFLIDNKYSDGINRMNDLLIDAAFGDLSYDASYFLYEWRPGFNITEADGTEWVLDTEEDYYKYFGAMMEKSKK